MELAQFEDIFLTFMFMLIVNKDIVNYFSSKTISKVVDRNLKIRKRSRVKI